MKKKIITLAIAAALATTKISAYAAEIPRESAPLNSTEAQIQITENLISDVLDEVQTGNLGYTLAAGNANTRIRKAVMANQTDGNGYGILSPIAQNAIRVIRDKQLQPDAYARAEEKLKILLADLMIDVRNGKDYNIAYGEARIIIYKAADASFNPNTDMTGDFCYWNVPPIDNAEFTVARKLLLEAQK